MPKAETEEWKSDLVEKEMNRSTEGAVDEDGQMETEMQQRSAFAD